MDIESKLAEFNRRKEISLRMGGKDRVERHHQRGHLTARERIDKLLDPGTFMETGMLVLNPVPGRSGEILHAPKVLGFGKIDGRTVFVQADDRTIFAGTGGGPRRQRGTDPAMAPEARFPLIALGDGAGVHLDSVMGASGTLAVTYQARTLLNPRRVPRVATIMGDCFGAPTWQAAISDFVVMVKGCCMAVSGPRVIEVALGEELTPEQLGGWQVHAEITGQVDAFAEDDEHCLQIVREFLSYMPSNCDEEPPLVPTADPPDRRVDEVLEILPEKATRVYDMHEIIRAIVDDGKYLALKPYFGKALITCLARMGGRTVGIIASQTMHNVGAAGPDECEKAASFIVLCDSFNIPLIFLSDTPGFLVGKAAEERKIPLKIMTWMEALALATVPKVSIIVRKAYGMAISNMAGTNCGSDFLAAWLTAEISFMSPEAAANVVHLHRIQAAADPEAERARFIKEMQRESEPWDPAAKSLLDDVIDPRDTRKYIIDCLNLLHEARGSFVSKKNLQAWPTGF